MVYEYLRKTYQDGEPIFLSDIKIPGISNENLRYYMKQLTDRGKIRRFESGIYYFPKTSILGNLVPLLPDEVVLYKYIQRNKKNFGYYSGNSLVNRLGLSTQVPFVEEITSNQAPALTRGITIKGQKYIIKRPVVEITEDNIFVLQLLDCLLMVDKCAELPPKECGKLLSDYAARFEITKDMVDSLIEYYPQRIYKALYETEVIYESTSRATRRF